jgi:adenine phosphoribosyltransferase
MAAGGWPAAVRGESGRAGAADAFVYKAIPTSYFTAELERRAMQHDDRIRITKLRELIRDVPDFPKPGVVFKDITPLLRDPAALSLAVEYLTQPFRGLHVDVVVGAESRGFIFGTAVARNLSAGFVPVRKPGKLPGETHSGSYELEYGADALHIKHDAVRKGERILMVDDVLATGGTMATCCRLVEALGGEIVGLAFLLELAFLNGRRHLQKYPIHSILKFDAA